MSFARAMTRGFSLIEMAIVLVVIGILLSGGLMAVAPVLDGTKQTQTESRLGTIESALQLYVIRNACLPCPADPALASTDANAGLANGTSYYSTSCSAAACDNARGVVPWRALGLAEADITDGWNRRISYAVSAGLQAADSMLRTPPSDYGTLGAIEVRTVGGAADSVTGEAAYVLVSHGKDEAYGNAISSGVAGAASHGEASGDPQFQNGNYSGTAPQDYFVQDTLSTINSDQYFDDMVKFRTKPMIIQMCGTNACGNPA